MEGAALSSPPSVSSRLIHDGIHAFVVDDVCSPAPTFDPIGVPFALPHTYRITYLKPFSHTRLWSAPSNNCFEHPPPFTGNDTNIYFVLFIDPLSSTHPSGGTINLELVQCWVAFSKVQGV